MKRLAIFAVGCLAAGCSGDAETGLSPADDDGSSSADGGGGRGSIGAGGTDAIAQGGAKPAQSCEPGTPASCYTGPPATSGRGMCRPGAQICQPDGSGYGPCEGQITPTTEVCATEGDDDCDGLSNEDGPDCGCDPGSIANCYSGPDATKGIGICHSGTQRCNDDGAGYGACTGEVLPIAEDCTTSEDENCDGESPACSGVTADLRGDTNRNGIVETTAADDDIDEHVWSSLQGAIFLPNLDDDEGRCPTTGSDTELASCSDATDSVINGLTDLDDLARLKTVAWPDAPAGSSGYLSVASPGSAYVRLFKRSGSNWSVYAPGSPLTAAELRAGVEFGVEGTDFVRDAAVYDGIVDVTLHVDNGAQVTASDMVRMRVAPVIFRHHLDPVRTYYVTSLAMGASQAFRNDLAAAASRAGVAVHNVYRNDQWTQDFFETAYMSLPSVAGQHVMHINFRSANFTGRLRSAGKVVFSDLRGADVAGAVVYDPSHSNQMDSLNSFGNLETIPPYTLGNEHWPLGRVLRGGISSYYPDPVFDTMVASQGVQGLVYIDTSWLLVGHVDETLSFVKADTPRGWVMLANDPTLAKRMLEDAQEAGYGSAEMFQGQRWSDGSSAVATIDQVLADPDVMNESAWAAVEVAEQLSVLKAETGLADDEIVPVPFLHWRASGASVAFQPGTVNGIYLGDDVFAAPDPHGPIIGNQDMFKVQLAAVLGDHGIGVSWIEDWDIYHRLSGEVHCGTNATREVPAQIKWWESGR